jgi:hypothetical protein
MVRRVNGKTIKKASNTRLSKFLNPDSLQIVNEWFKNRSNTPVRCPKIG